MTLMIILGGVAALYGLWLLFRLAVLAFPIYTGIAAAFLLQGQGYGMMAMLAAGFAAGLAVHLGGRTICASATSPLLRLMTSIAFVLPAAFAGYQAAAGLVALMIGDPSRVRMLSLAGGLIAAIATLRGLRGSTVPDGSNFPAKAPGTAPSP